MAYKTQFDDGLELAQFQTKVDDYDDGKEVSLRSPGRNSTASEYGGMEVHQYGGGVARALSTGTGIPEDESEKLPFNSRKYEENLRSRLRRDLKTRQISMIAIGGALGTGLLINT
jgi:amino acid transporter